MIKHYNFIEIERIKMYKINIPHFYCLEYYERGKVIKLDIDFREPRIYLSTELVNKWEPPYENVTISEFEKERIIFNVSNYLKKNGYSKGDIVIY